MDGPDFRLSLSGHRASSSTAGDPLSRFSGTAFSAPDRERDSSKRGHCAKKYRSGWWFASCGASNLNGLNYNSAKAPEARGIVFTDERHPFNYSYAGVAMMIRPNAIK